MSKEVREQHPRTTAEFDRIKALAESGEITTEDAVVALVELAKLLERDLAEERQEHQATLKLAAEARAKLDDARVVGIPAGWKLVPIEPTDAMIYAMTRATANYDERKDSYRAMLAAAPRSGEVATKCLAQGCTRKVRTGQWCWQHADMEHVQLREPDAVLNVSCQRMEVLRAKVREWLDKTSDYKLAGLLTSIDIELRRAATQDVPPKMGLQLEGAFDHANDRAALGAYLDGLAITGDTIGDIRRSLFHPFDCPWNGLVRDMTAERERRSGAPPEEHRP